MALEKQHIGIAIRGALMGIADVVPGFSGGTVALLTGIYSRLIRAIAGFDRQLIPLIKKREWSAVWRHVDAGFLVCLVTGILCGALVMNLTVTKMLQQDWTRNLTLACFFGLLLAGGWTLGKKILKSYGSPGPVELIFGAVGLLLALGMTLSPSLQISGEPSLLTLFFAGMIAICAMILPGISGALLLVLMGLYSFLTAIPSDVLHGKEIVGNLLKLSTFGCGCLIGLATIARLLKFGLKKWPKIIMTFLWGLMIGTFPALWPFQSCTNPDQAKLALRQYNRLAPELGDSFTWLLLLVVIGSCVLLIVIENIANRSNDKDLLDEF